MAPVTLGHEFVGRIIDAADDVQLPIGQRVCADACLRCHSCFWCCASTTHVSSGGSIGYHLDGAFASRVRLPAYTLSSVPDAVGDASAAIVEPLAVGLHALKRARFEAGETVVVIGFGMVGASVAVLARALGAASVVVVEPSAARSVLPRRSLRRIRLPQLVARRAYA